MTSRALVFLATALGAAVLQGAYAQQTFIHAGWLLDLESGQWLRERTIVVEGERISAVEERSKIELAAGDGVIDWSDAYVLPGLIDAHVHMTADHRYHGYQRLGISVPRQTLFGVVSARRTLAAGFTTVRSLGSAGYADVALRDAIDDGDLSGPRMLVSGPSLGMTGGHCDNNLLPPRFDHTAEGVGDGPWAVRASVRRNDKYGVDVIKFCATGGVLSKGDKVGTQQFTFEEMAAVVDEAHRLGFRVAAHAHGTEGIKDAIRAGVDSVEHASLLDDEAITLARDHGTHLVMDIYVSDYILSSGAAAGILEESLQKERQVGQAQRDSFRRAVQAGVTVTFGTDASIFPHGTNARQFAYMVEWGMAPLEAIRAATTSAAALLGLSGQVGVIAPGAYADLVALEKDPLVEIRVLERDVRVIKGGRLVPPAH